MLFVNHLHRLVVIGVIDLGEADRPYRGNLPGGGREQRPSQRRDQFGNSSDVRHLVLLQNQESSVIQSYGSVVVVQVTRYGGFLTETLQNTLRHLYLDIF